MPSTSGYVSDREYMCVLKTFKFQCPQHRATCRTETSNTYIVVMAGFNALNIGLHVRPEIEKEIAQTWFQCPKHRATCPIDRRKHHDWQRRVSIPSTSGYMSDDVRCVSWFASCEVSIPSTSGYVSDLVTSS